MQILRKAGATIFLLFLYARALITSFQKVKYFKGIVPTRLDRLESGPVKDRPEFGYTLQF